MLPIELSDIIDNLNTRSFGVANVPKLESKLISQYRYVITKLVRAKQHMIDMECNTTEPDILTNALISVIKLQCHFDDLRKKLMICGYQFEDISYILR